MVLRYSVPTLLDSQDSPATPRPAGTTKRGPAGQLRTDTRAGDHTHAERQEREPGLDRRVPNICR